MSRYLFIYGTLQPGHAPDEIAVAVERLRLVGRGTVSGVLYDLGDYPGAVLGGNRQSRIFGTVFELPDDANVLQALDEYEGFNPEAIAESLFVRVEHAVEMADGRALNCWIYAYNLDPVGARILLRGKYPETT